MIPDYTPNIWQWFKTNTMFTDAGIAAVMGNLEAESNCEPCRVEGDFSKDRHISKEYADSVMTGAYTGFVNDAKGWGVYQLTYYTRKQGFLNFCKENNARIDNLDIQLKYLVKEMQTDFPSLYSLFCSSNDVSTLAKKFMVQFENPFDKSDATQTRRANQAQGFYATFHNKNVVVDEIKDTSTPVPTTAIVDALTIIADGLYKLILTITEGGNQ